MMDNSKEYIVCSAYKVKPEFVGKPNTALHPSLQEEGKYYDDIHMVRLGRYHCNILRLFYDEIDENTDGFFTSYGRWVDRKQALEIALACGQCEKDKLVMGWGLDSSDIFK